MLLYMGSGAAWAAHRRGQRVHDLTECGQACGLLLGWCAQRLEAEVGDDVQRAFAEGLASASDCMHHCRWAASLGAQASELTGFALLACAESCRRCSAACELLSPDEIANECARLCRQAEQVCCDLDGSLRQSSSA